MEEQVEMTVRYMNSKLACFHAGDIVEIPASVFENSKKAIRAKIIKIYPRIVSFETIDKHKKFTLTYPEAVKIQMVLSERETTRNSELDEISIAKALSGKRLGEKEDHEMRSMQKRTDQ